MIHRPSFDLTTEPWLPVIRRGSLDEVGLRELFRAAHDIEDLAIPVPPAASGIWRILYAITARITGLDDTGLDLRPWSRRRNDLITSSHGFDQDAVEEYFDRWAARFDLFDPERPWLQDPRLATQCEKDAGVNKLVFSRNSGQNHVWFDHHHDQHLDPLPAKEAAWHLVAQLYYGAAGRCSTRRVGTTSQAKTQAGPLRGRLSFHPVGENLFQSLLAGLVHPKRFRTDGQPPPDLAPWETEELPDPLGIPPCPAGLVSALTNRARHALLLTPTPDGGQVSGARLTWAFHHAAGEFEDPYLIHQVATSGAVYARPADGHRALWRDLDALVNEENEADPRKASRPRVLREATNLPPKVQDALRVRAFGFDQDRQSKDNGWFTAITPPILKWAKERDPDMAYGIARARVAAEEAQRRLAEALRKAWRDYSRRDPKGPNPWIPAADSRYWPRAERVFWQVIDQRAFDQVDQAFTRLALEVYEEVTDMTCRQPRGARAVYRHRPGLFSPTRKPAAPIATRGAA
ncbi:hypothetical protein TH66_22735 [Carbonactinospora thermoautotrophica]|uniref:Type I-E CRISPR-associated protein Cse1/CasA n=1 Tax=Carbonactinospora thermoautotrophica TaxID=1469144 RepID=A0A132MK13_9ACTN|nr:type I-E CRISPR-associated protein Cse1/CasA [Carbonactinospora thermoautotrophica]KWW98095.1 hypothetical protein TH66_22735 [Carbonactinospora thermoautotrophica]KWX07947.1 hypothetical protein TR74_17035 [Carbonactinospora thermoautotrophica]